MHISVCLVFFVVVRDNLYKLRHTGDNYLSTIQNIHIQLYIHIEERCSKMINN